MEVHISHLTGLFTQQASKAYTLILPDANG